MSKIEDKEKDGKLDQLSSMVEQLSGIVKGMDRRIKDMSNILLFAEMPEMHTSSMATAEALGVSDRTVAHIVGTFAMNKFGGLGEGL